MTRRQAHVMALRWAWEAIQKAVDGGPTNNINNSEDDQAKCDQQLDIVCQQMYERWLRAKERIER